MRLIKKRKRISPISLNVTEVFYRLKSIENIINKITKKIQLTESKNFLFSRAIFHQSL